MNILAIIPARAGSRGIPNKNIRLINGKALISYSIDTALASKYITEIIVSTDSEAVKTIAQNKGILVRHRKPELCGDSITLDSVIYDAQKGKQCDYVITLQPTSPTLTTKTLDSAIEFAIKNNFDTLISVKNHPHLAWRVSEDNDTIIPAYKERLNRQYLPPYYEETGAFVISKQDIVSPTSRIGGRIGVFEIPDDEAIDIDSFLDLKLAEAVLSQKKVAFFVNGNNSIGLGHIYRALELADEFYCKPDIIYDRNKTTRDAFTKTTHNLIGVDGLDGLLDYISNQSYQIFINDNLSSDIEYMSKIKFALPETCKIISIEDDGPGTQLVDLTINALYNFSNHENTFYGEQYYIVPKIFLLYQPLNIARSVKNVFICFGGADPRNYTAQVLGIISSNEKYSSFNFTVVIGRANTNLSSIISKYNTLNNINIHYDILNMPELMLQNDIAITSRGRTAFELASLGIPTISIAQNEREMLHNFISTQNGFEYLGYRPSDEDITRSLDYFLSTTLNDRKSIQDKLLKHDLRNGRSRVMHLIRSL